MHRRYHVWMPIAVERRGCRAATRTRFSRPRGLKPGRVIRRRPQPSSKRSARASRRRRTNDMSATMTPLTELGVDAARPTLKALLGAVALRAADRVRERRQPAARASRPRAARSSIARRRSARPARGWRRSCWPKGSCWRSPAASPGSSSRGPGPRRSRSRCPASIAFAPFRNGQRHPEHLRAPALPRPSRS